MKTVFIFRRAGLGLLAGVLLSGPPAAQALTDAQRAQAATATANNNAYCTALPKFYWEIGDRNGRLAYGSRGSLPPKQTDQMQIYSASKWIYGAYVYQRRGGQLNATDLQNLRMRAGYTENSQCIFNTTVGSCYEAMNAQDPGAVDKFYYAPGQFQKHAAIDMGLYNDTRSQLAADIQAYVGNDWTLTYNQPQLSGGGRSSAADYAIFLRKLLNGTLLLSGSALGSNAVCTYTDPTDPATGRQHCDAALYSPVDDPAAGSQEAWHYSIGHWVEDDPVWLAGGGDAAYSSPGAAGFYPWIDASRTYYGILARFQIAATAAADSVACGRLIRKAWLTGTAQ